MSRFKDKLAKMIKDANSRFDDHSISPKIRQILLHWGYGLTESDCYDLFFYFFVNIKMRYYWFNRQELLQKAKEKYDNGGKEKAAQYYQDNKDARKEKSNSKYGILSEEEKEAKKSIGRIVIKYERKCKFIFTV